MDEWIKKLWYIYEMGYYSAMTTWMDLKGIMLSKTNQTEKEKYHKISFICVILKQKASSEM